MAHLQAPTHRLILQLAKEPNFCHRTIADIGFNKHEEYEMSNSKRQNIISAADTSIGFDYQFYYFFFLILGLKHGEKIGLEEKDDVHIELSDGTLILIQTKHTLQTQTNGETINLTERDKDLWKTVSNWTKIIKEQTAPKDYIENTRFQLISNKSVSTNQFLQNLIKAKNNDIKIADFKKYLTELHDNTSDVNICNFINELRTLKSPLLKDFIGKIEFQFNEDDLIAKIKRRIEEKIYFPERVDDVYNCLQSELRDTSYLKIKKGVVNTVSFEGFRDKFKNCFRKGLSRNLPIRKFDIKFPTSPEEQNFIKQLLEIEDITIEDKDLIIEFTTHMLQLYNHLKEWEESGDLMPSQVKDFNKETIQIWKNSFRAKFRSVSSKIKSGVALDHLDDEIKVTAVSFLDEMRNQILKVDETILSTELSNGHFYLLTDDNLIGWHYDWENKYTI
ncbi:MAG: hypothetical protein N4A71_13880 [Carboxylicivirga sp.]|nr:hypothetical protein [Carboxylicivirga sp.]MCT4645673.1 hypothetical protein [Carboxylicivirga sp.]